MVRCNSRSTRDYWYPLYAAAFLQQELQQTMQEEANDKAADAASGAKVVLDDGYWG
jgi:hypothetical protein